MKLAKNPVFLHYYSKFMAILIFVLKYMYISLLLKMINGFSWPAKIMASPFNVGNTHKWCRQTMTDKVIFEYRHIVKQYVWSWISLKIKICWKWLAMHYIVIHVWSLPFPTWHQHIFTYKSIALFYSDLTENCIELSKTSMPNYWSVVLEKMFIISEVSHQAWKMVISIHGRNPAIFPQHGRVSYPSISDKAAEYLCFQVIKFSSKEFPEFSFLGLTYQKWSRCVVTNWGSLYRKLIDNWGLPFEQRKNTWENI